MDQPHWWQNGMKVSNNTYDTVDPSARKEKLLPPSDLVSCRIERRLAMAEDHTSPHFANLLVEAARLHGENSERTTRLETYKISFSPAGS